jgi:hypothetical protein
MNGVYAMHIGIDIDNTIIDYHTLFFQGAKTYNLILPPNETHKIFVKKEIVKLPDGENKWTKLQGYIYGSQIEKAKLSNGFTAFLKVCKRKKVKISLISHKSKYTKRGRKINLHKKAMLFLKNRNLLDTYIHKNNIYFGSSNREKIRIMRQLGCTHFIDDLLEIFTNKSFPANVVKILYTQDVKTEKLESIFQGDWYGITRFLFD